MDETGELTAEMAHPAFEPIAALIGDGASEGIDEAGAVRANNGHNESREHRLSVRGKRRRSKGGITKGCSNYETRGEVDRR